MAYAYACRRSIIRVCVAGDIATKCMARSEHASMMGKKCEVVTADCHCYRWEYDERLTNAPTSVQTAASETRANCAIVKYDPQRRDRLVTVDLFFALGSQYPVAPASYYYVLQKQYERYAKLAKYPVAFFQFVQARLPLECAKAANTSSVALPHIASSCTKYFMLAMVPLHTEDARNAQTGNIIAPLIISTHMAGIIGILLHSKINARKKDKCCQE